MPPVADETLFRIAFSVLLIVGLLGIAVLLDKLVQRWTRQVPYLSEETDATLHVQQKRNPPRQNSARLSTRFDGDRG